MANIILTNRCNLQCPFCFASENQVKEDKTQFTLKQIENLIHFLDPSKKDFRLCGGEPSLNNEIIPILKLLLKAGYRPFFMTNGIWPKDFMNFMATLPVEHMTRFSFLFNLLSPELYSQDSLDKINETLSIVNPAKSTIGITIYKDSFEYDYIVELAKKYSIGSVRISVAAPNISSGKYLLEKDFYSVAQRLIDFIDRLQENNIKVVKDCNYIPPCFFSEDQKLKLKYELKGNWNFSCTSSPIDVDNEGNAWRCYGMYSLLRTKVDNFKTETRMKQYFDRRMKIVSANLYPYTECKSCNYWQSTCQGGCYTIRIKKALEIDNNINFFPIDDDHDILRCSPSRSRDLTIKEVGGRHILFHNKTLIENPEYNTLEFLREIDGNKTISDLIAKWESNFDSYDQTKTEVIGMCRKLFELDLIEINYDYNVDLGCRPQNQGTVLC